MKNRRVWLYVAAALVVAALGWMVLSPKGAKGKPRTSVVERGRIVASVSATGTINPVVEVQVGSQISGTIEKLHADYNDHVTKGQILVELEPSLLRTAVVQAQANVAHAQAAVNDAKRTQDRSQALFKQNVIAEVDVQASELAYAQRVAELKQARAALGTAQVNLDHAIIRSPISGVVVSRAVDVGQTVAASLSAPTLFTIAEDLSHMRVETKIDESDVGRIRPGLRATFTVDSYPNDTFEGQVSQVRLEPVVTDNVVTYTTLVDVPNPDNKLRPGMTANVTLITDTRQDVLRVPNAALRFRPTDASQVEGGVLPGRGNANAAAAQGGDPSGGGNGGGGGGGGRGGWRQRMANGDTTGMAARRARFAAGGGDTTGMAARRARWASGDTTGMAAARARFAGMGGEGMGMRRGGGEQRNQTVYVLQPNKKMKPVTIRTGITDGAFTEVVSGPLKEGDLVVTGIEGQTSAQSNNLSAPPGFGGGIRGGGGRGGGR
ncbi:MAG TPA: efflux RND transporter periplasmic adaptor subunit [Candidatus Eisenbacteria bacterium]|nr:efflux RND transporter periplasmic adaptor subunit [Candidatus Eisenbacteria bacterium]